MLSGLSCSTYYMYNLAIISILALTTFLPWSTTGVVFGFLGKATIMPFIVDPEEEDTSSTVNKTSYIYNFQISCSTSHNHPCF